MIFVRYISHLLDIEADEHGFNAVRQAIADVVDGIAVASRIATDKIDPSPYEHNPTSLVIERSDSANSFIRDGSQLIIRGSKPSLTSLSLNLPVGNERTLSGIKYHHHYDHISFPDYCSDDTPDATLSVATASDSR